MKAVMIAAVLLLAGVAGVESYRQAELERIFREK